jgi:hypothetical protein
MRRNKSGLPKYCGWNTDRHGKRRVRFRKDGFSTYLTGTPWGEDFMRQLAQAIDGVRAQVQNVGAEFRTKPGSLNELCVAYYRSPGFLDLKASTKDGRRGIIESFRRLHGDKPVAMLQRTRRADNCREVRNAERRQQPPQSSQAAAEPRSRCRHDRHQSGSRHQAV